MELKHYAEEADVIGAAEFGEGQCRAPFRLRYVEGEDTKNQTLTVVKDPRSLEDLVVTGMIYVDDNQRAIIGTLAAASTREKSCARERLVAYGIDPDTFKPVSHDAGMAREMPYLDFLQALLPQQRREAIFDLASVVWRANPGGLDGNPLFMGHPKLAPELARLGIRELGEGYRCHEVGPVEFAGGRCTAVVLYHLYGGGDGVERLGYYVQIHILGGIGNKPGGGGDIRILDLWFRTESIDDPPSDTTQPLLVPWAKFVFGAF